MSTHRILAATTSVIVCAFVLGITGFTATGHAADTSPAALAEQAADSYWGNAPCAGQIAIAWQQSTPTPALPGTEVEAWVTFQTPDGPLDFGAAPATYTECIVYISTTTWPTYASTVQAYPQFCQMMVHEFGHFQGYADSMSYQPSDIRYPLLTDANLPAVCMYDLPLSSSSQPNGFPSLPGTRDRGSTADLSRVRTRCFEVRCSVPRRRSKLRWR